MITKRRSSDQHPQIRGQIDWPAFGHGSIEKLELYADIKVPKVWRYDGASLRVFRFQASGTYAEQPQSGVFPFLPLAERLG